MAIIQLKDGNGTLQYFEVTGAGTIGDPYIPLSDLSVAGVPVNAAAPVPVMDSTMRNLQASIADLTETINYYLAAIHEKMGRLDTADRLAVTIEAGSVGISAAQTLATVTTLATLTTAGTLQNLGVASRPADGIPHQLSNMGALHIYNNISIS